MRCVAFILLFLGCLSFRSGLILLLFVSLFNSFWKCSYYPVSSAIFPLYFSLCYLYVFSIHSQSTFCLIAISAAVLILLVILFLYAIFSKGTIPFINDKTTRVPDARGANVGMRESRVRSECGGLHGSARVVNRAQVSVGGAFAGGIVRMLHVYNTRTSALFLNLFSRQLPLDRFIDTTIVLHSLSEFKLKRLTTVTTRSKQ